MEAKARLVGFKTPKAAYVLCPSIIRCERMEKAFLPGPMIANIDSVLWADSLQSVPTKRINVTGPGETMTAMSSDAFEPQAQLEAIRQLLGKAIRAVRKREGRLMQVEDAVRVQEGLEDVVGICDLYREALFEQIHSVRVRQITEDFESLVAMMNAYGDREMTAEDQAKIRARIKGWCHEARRWIAELPMQPVVKRLPDQDGLDGQVRFVRLKACWLEAGGAYFTPPPRRGEAMAAGVPSHFQIAPLGPHAGWTVDAMDMVMPDTGRPKWECRPTAVLELLGYAQEALLLEVGGPDRGGRTTITQRLRRASLKDALAFSCIVVYERVVGAKSARQSQSGRRSASRKLFEIFVSQVHALAVGGDGLQDWSLGPDPIRKAIATQRVWQKLFRTAGAVDHDGFNAIPLEDQQAAASRLKPKERRRLTPVAPPWVW